MKKLCVAIFATAIIGVGSIFVLPSNAHADLNQIQVEIDETQQKLSEVNKQIDKLDQAIVDNQKQIDDTEEKIHNTQTEIDQLQAEREKIIERMEKREELIKDRMRFLQKNGGNIGYLEVLFESASFEDFISRAIAIATITKSDQDLIAEQAKDAEKLEEKEAIANAKLNELKELKVELEGMQAQISEQKAQVEAMKAEYEEKIQQLTEEQRRILEEERRARLEAERLARLEAERQAQQAQAEGNSGNENSGSPSASAPQPAIPTASGSEAIQIVTTVGNKYIGNSVYVFAGGRTAYDIANGRFDCSGFVSWAFSQAGYTIPASTAGLATYGTKVSTSEMRPGDIVFFDTYKTNGHVGIYLGNGKFIGSQNNTGVAIADMTSGYWKQHFKGHIRRIIH